MDDSIAFLLNHISSWQLPTKAWSNQLQGNEASTWLSRMWAEIPGNERTIPVSPPVSSFSTYLLPRGFIITICYQTHFSDRSHPLCLSLFTNREASKVTLRRINTYFAHAERIASRRAGAGWSEVMSRGQSVWRAIAAGSLLRLMVDTGR